MVRLSHSDNHDFYIFIKFWIETTQISIISHGKRLLADSALWCAAGGRASTIGFRTKIHFETVMILRTLTPHASEKQDGRSGLWLAETFSTSPLKPLNGIQRNLTGNKISTSSTKFVFFGPIGKTRWPPWPLIGWDIFNFSETAERNSMKLNRKQDLNILYQVCVFRADQ